MKSREVRAGSRSELALVLDIMEMGGQKPVCWEPVRWSNTTYLVYYEDGEVDDESPETRKNTESKGPEIAT